MMHRTKSRAAFTLVELLAAMAVLAIMMLMFANIFSSSGKAWTSGTRRAEQNMNGRAVLEYMSKEIGQAIVNTNGIVFQAVNPGGTYSVASYTTPNTALHFVALRGCNSGSTPDEARLIHYYVKLDTADGYNNYQLMRALRSDKATIDAAYRTTSLSWLTDKSGPTVFVDHITQFYVVANGNNANYRSNLQTPKALPQYVDIIIGFLSEDDARKASFLTGTAQLNYVTKAEKRFTRRIYMQNRTGYLPVQ
ncbi:MAG: type II secretion system protein [Kiritimatiellaeota bacterium]|nr:type II secretion system protein [Kiritimatiellota bacterium]